MREYGKEGQFSRLLSETAERVRSLPPMKKHFKPVKAESANTHDEEDWQIEGQMTIYDLAS